MKAGAKLKLFLQERRVKQSIVAARIGMNKKTFNAILNGHANLRADTLEAVCDFLEVSPTVFFNYRVQDNGIKEA